MILIVRADQAPRRSRRTKPLMLDAGQDAQKGMHTSFFMNRRLDMATADHSESNSVISPEEEDEIHANDP